MEAGRRSASVQGGHVNSVDHLSTTLVDDRSKAIRRIDSVESFGAPG